MFMHVHFDEEKLPKFLIPPGKWRVWVQLRDGATVMSTGIMNFEIIEYSSIKQRNRFG